MQLDGQREKTGHNDGPAVKAVLASCNLPEGYAYCAATVNWTFVNAGVETGVKNPAYSPNWFTNTSKVTYKRAWRKPDYKSKKAQVFGLWFQQLGRIAHVGFIIAETVTHYITFEGNTSLQGAIESDVALTDADREAGVNGGFCKKYRLKKLVYIISDYLTEYETGQKDWRKNTIYK
jgi:hypothetical protein